MTPVLHKVEDHYEIRDQDTDDLLAVAADTDDAVRILHEMRTAHGGQEGLLSWWLG